MNDLEFEFSELASKLTSENTHELIDYKMVFKLCGATFVTQPARLPGLGYVANQLKWYAMAKNDVAYIRQCAKPMWSRVVDDTDVNSNYGRYAFAEGQLNVCIDRLKLDANTRRAVIMFNRPNVNVSNTNDHICTTSVQFLIRGNKLNVITTMRSNDLWHGFRFDVAFFTFLADYVRAELCTTYSGLTFGFYSHNVGSMHIAKCHGTWSTGPTTQTVFAPLKPGEGPALIERLKSTNPEKDIKAGYNHTQEIVNLLRIYE